jgi:hypothetical protein
MDDECQVFSIKNLTLSFKPYYVYLKMAYHLSQEARDGLSNYQTPANFGLLPFQSVLASEDND